MASIDQKSMLCAMFILVLGLLSLTWFKDDYLIAGRDIELPYVSQMYIIREETLSTWDGIFGREASSSTASLFPRLVYFALCEYLGVPLLASEKVLFYVLFATPGLFMFLLVTHLVQDERKYLAGLISAVFYMMNPWNMIFRWSGLALSPLFMYAVFPLTLLLFIRGLNSGQHNLKHALLVGLSTLLFACSGSTPAYVVVAWIILLAYQVFDAVWRWNLGLGVKKGFRFTLLAFIVILALNAWWFVPMIWAVPSRYVSVFQSGFEGERTLASLMLESRDASVFNILRMFGHWGFYSGFLGDPYYTFAPLYQTATFVLISCLFPILAFSALLWRRNRFVIFFSALAFIGSFLMKGTHDPLGEVYGWTFFNLPGFMIFRMQFDKFGILQVLGYAFLLGHSVSHLYVDIKRRIDSSKLKPSFVVATGSVWRGTIAVLLVILLGVYMFPFWTGEVIPRAQTRLKGAYVKIPSYYYDAGNWVSSQPGDFKVLTLPFRMNTSSPSVTLTWGFDGADIARQFVHKPLIQSGNTPPPEELTNKMYEMFRHEKTLYFGKLLGMMNIRYILLYNDFVYQDYLGQVDSPQNIMFLLKQQRGIQFRQSFGELDFYENVYWLPHIYATSNIICANTSSYEELLQVYLNNAQNETFSSNPPVILNGLWNEKIMNAINSMTDYPRKNDASEIRFERVAPYWYEIHVKTAGPFVLVFSDPYHEGWEAYYGETDQIQAWLRVPIQSHFMVNGYQNAWYIDKGGEYTITLYFTFQYVLYGGSVITLSALVVIATILYHDAGKIKKRLKEEKETLELVWDDERTPPPEKKERG